MPPFIRPIIISKPTLPAGKEDPSPDVFMPGATCRVVWFIPTPLASAELNERVSCPLRISPIILSIIALFSVDDFFTNAATGEYTFNFKDNHLAYKQCEEFTREAMQQNRTKIFVHNTFTMDWELEPYFKLADEFNYELFVITVENYHHHKNIHEVSDEQLHKMAEKYKVKLL